MTSHAKPHQIRLIVLDVDGVLTDGSLWIDADGRETKQFNVRDGQGIRIWLDQGYKIAIITGRTSRALTHRARELGIEYVYQGSRDKLGDYNDLLQRVEMQAAESAMVGDDLPDLRVLHAVGFPVAVGNAADEVKAEAAFVTALPGGHGAVRELIEHLLRSRGEWDTVVARLAGRDL